MEKRKMEYIYAAMLLHKAGQKVDEGSLTKVLEAVGASPDNARVKAVVSALEGVDIEQAIKEAAVAPVASAAPAGGTAETPAAETKADNKSSEKEQKQSEEKAAAGLGALFG